MFKISIIFLFLLQYLVKIYSQSFDLDLIIKRPNPKTLNYITFLDMDVPVQINDKNQIIVKIGMGSDPQYSQVLVDTGSNILWIAGTNCNPCDGVKNKFDPLKSKTFVNTTENYNIAYGTGSTQGFVSIDTLNIGNLTSPEFQFLLSYDSGTDMFSDGILGIGNLYSNNENSFSLLDQLYSQKKISKRIFSQELFKNDTGKITFGDIPDEIKNNKNDSKLNYGKCKSFKKNNNGKPNLYWECQLDQVFFGYDVNNTIDISSRINFDTGTNFILVPKLFYYDYILKIYLKEFIDREICKSNVEENFIQILCSPILNLKNIDNFNLKLGDNVMILRPEDIFENRGNFYQFKISSSTLDYLDSWILGAPVLQKYIMTFDNDNQEIGYFGEDVMKIEQIEKKQNYDYLIFIIIGLILLVLVGIYFFIKYRKNIENGKVLDNYQNFNFNSSSNTRNQRDF